MEQHCKPTIQTPIPEEFYSQGVSVSPSVYMTIQSISAIACPVGLHGPRTTIGTAVDETILSFGQNVIMSYGCGKGAPQPINYADFNTPVPWSIVSRQFDRTLGVLATRHPPWEYDYEYTMRPPPQYPAEIRTAINTDWLCALLRRLWLIHLTH